MFRNILKTLGSKVIIGISNFVILLITTNLFGAEIKGEISLFILSISVATLISGFAGGPALVYLLPRGNFLSLFLINLVWSIFSVGVFFALLNTITSLSINIWLLYGVAMLESIIAINLMLLLGQEKITEHNLVQIVKVLSTLFILVTLGLTSDASLDLFVWAFCASLIISFLLSLYFLRHSFNGSTLSISRKELINSLKLGFTVQIGSLAQLLNYRLSYYLLEWLISPPEIALVRIGIFSTATQIAESLWQVTRSVNTVQYARIANMTDRVSALEITAVLSRMNTIVTVAGITILLCMPASFYALLFGNDFYEVKTQIWLLSPGILALAFSAAISQFFSGVGDYKFNTITSLITLLLSICVGIPAINALDIDGASIATSIVYTVQAIMLLFFLLKREKISFASFQPRIDDLSLLKSKMIAVWNSKK